MASPLASPTPSLSAFDEDLHSLSSFGALDDAAAVPAAPEAAAAAPAAGDAVRRGKWTAPECDYAALVIEHFGSGRLPGLAGGESLRATLSELLGCAPMRITKKLSATRAHGKQCFKKRGELGARDRVALERARARFLASLDGGAPPAAEGDAAAPSVKLPKSDAVRSQSKGVMGGVLDGVRGAIADVGNVVKLAGDLGHLHSNFDEAIESLAYVEHCVPKIVSALEMLQSVVQVILKAVQGVAFPPNPAVIVDLMHTSRRVMKQAASVVDVYDSQADLAKSVGILSKFALKLVDSIARTAALLKNAPSLGCCDSCVACCSSMSGATATGSRLAGV